MSSRNSKKTVVRKRNKQVQNPAHPRLAKFQHTYGSPRSMATMVPPELFIKLTYTEQIILNATSASTDNYVFRANDIYDPNYSGTGHQPLGYDQWTTFYERWVVESATCNFVSTPPNLSTATPQINNCILLLTIRGDYVTVYTNVATAIEDPYCVSHKLTSGYQRQPVLRARIDNAKMLGVSKTVYMSSEEYSGGIGASPTIQTYFIAAAGSCLGGGGLDPDPVYATVEINYYVKFYSVIEPAGSSLAGRPVKLLPGHRDAPLSPKEQKVDAISPIARPIPKVRL